MMSIVRIVSLAPLLLLALGAPSIAATRAWPLQISQPVAATNITPATTYIVLCSISLSGAVVEAESPFTPTLAGGVLTFNGTVPVTIAPSPGVRLPATGDVVTCKLREKIAGNFSDFGTLATMKIP